MITYARKFGGKHYRLVGKSNSKMRADEAANRIRRGGHSARVVRVAGGYAIYRG